MPFIFYVAYKISYILFVILTMYDIVALHFARYIYNLFKQLMNYLVLLKDNGKCQQTVKVLI